MSEDDRSFDAIHSALANRPFPEQLAFGIGLLERSLPEYFQFQQDTGWLGGGDLRAALAQCWRTLEAGRLTDDVEIGPLRQRCARWLPDSEDHHSAYISAAINAVDIACHLLDYMQSTNPRGVLDAATARRDTLDLFIQMLPVDVEVPIAKHPLMRTEMQAMHGDLAAIDAAPNGGLAQHLLRRVSSEHYGELRLGAVFR